MKTTLWDVAVRSLSSSRLRQKARFCKRVGVPGCTLFRDAGRRRTARAIAADCGPEHAFDLVHHHPFGGNFNLFIITLNSLMEWLLIPAALFFNWRIPKRRTLIVIAAFVYYAMQVWTYVYFVPNIFEFEVLPSDAQFSAELVERFRLWVNLSCFRLVIDVSTNLRFLLAAFPLPQIAPSRNRQMRK